jgi:hypothetical protein
MFIAVVADGELNDYDADYYDADYDAVGSQAPVLDFLSFCFTSL